MTKKSAILFCFLTIPFVIFSQVRINGEIPKDLFPEKTIIYFGKYTGSDFSIIDSMTVSTDWTFSFILPQKYTEGIYELQVGKNNGMPLVIGKNNKSINFKISLSESGSINLPRCDNENSAFAEMLDLVSMKERQIQNVLERKNNLLIDNNNSVAVLNPYMRMYDSLQFDLNKKLESLKQLYSDTYTSAILINMFKAVAYKHELPGYKKEEELEYNQQHFFDGYAFEDERIIYNPIITEKYLAYLGNFSKNETEGFKKCVDILMSKVDANKAVKQFTKKYLINIFLQKGPEEVVNYIYDNYVENCSENIPDRSIRQIKQQRNFTIGTKVPDIDSYSPDGSPISLYSIKKENKIILIYFWASWCSHCQSELPEMLKLYEKYKSNGFQIYAVSLDDKKDEWLNVVTNLKLNWVNVSDLKKFESEAAKNYFVFGTPANFLIDQEGKIISKNSSVEQLSLQIESVLK